MSPVRFWLWGSIYTFCYIFFVLGLLLIMLGHPLGRRCSMGVAACYRVWPRE
ncbi:hypothetical protein BJY00DRAFT_283118 [Aspergillus carlsbadensis]|nr:hypothetical protein BJY00DRAFT_283118 [Aspergillus carlsbadensis]